MTTSNKIIAVAAVLTAATLVLAVSSSNNQLRHNQHSLLTADGNTITIQRNEQHKSVSGSGNTVHQEHHNIITRVVAVEDVGPVEDRKSVI